MTNIILITQVILMMNKRGLKFLPIHAFITRIISRETRRKVFMLHDRHALANITLAGNRRLDYLTRWADSCSILPIVHRFWHSKTPLKTRGMRQLQLTPHQIGLFPGGVRVRVWAT